jgi:uncharacterized protein YndB with AHSA1/START domain
MALKTRINAEDGRHDLQITRDFDLPVELLFTAYTDAEIVAQWMNTKVVKLDSHPYGGWQFETSDKEGNVVFAAHGTIHTLLPNEKIVRTFEMRNAPFDVQLEFLSFEALSDTTSRLTIQIVYRSIAIRDQMLQLPFAQGLNMAHNQLENIMHSNKK